MGLPYCLNKGIEKAQGHFFLRLDSDDYVNEFYVEENARVKKAQGNSGNTKSLTTDGKVTAPEFLKHAKKQPSKPTYSTKASKK